VRQANQRNMRWLLFAFPKINRQDSSRHKIALALFLPLFFSGLREASPPAQYALAFIRYS